MFTHKKHHCPVTVRFILSFSEGPKGALANHDSAISQSGFVRAVMSPKSQVFVLKYFMIDDIDDIQP